MKGWTYKGYFDNGKAEDMGVFIAGSDFGLDRRFFDNISSSLSVARGDKSTARLLRKGTSKEFGRMDSIATPGSSSIQRKKFDEFSLDHKKYLEKQELLRKQKLTPGYYKKIIDPDPESKLQYDIKIEAGGVCY